MSVPLTGAQAMFESFPADMKADILAIADEHRKQTARAMRPTRMSRVRGTIVHARVATVHVVKSGARKVKRVAFDAKNIVFRLVNAMIDSFENYLKKHPTLQAFLTTALAFTVGFVGFILLWTAIMLSLVMVIFLFGA